jgi:hypothetical protein
MKCAGARKAATPRVAHVRKRQGQILVETVGEVEKIWRRCSGLAHDPHRKLGLRVGQLNQRRVHVVYICIGVLMNHDCSTTSLIFQFITITTKFLSKHCIKRVLDTEMNGYRCFSFTEKLS